MRLQPDIEFHRRLTNWSRYLVWTTFFIAILVLLGWQLSIPLLKGKFPQLVTMNPVTAVSFILSVISFRLQTSKGAKPFLLWGRFAALIVVVIGILKLLTFIPGFHFEVDRLLYSQKLEINYFSNFTNRMAPNTAICFVLTGLSLLLLKLETKTKKVPAHYFALIVFIIGLFSLLGYLYQVQSFYRIGIHIPMAIHTSFSFIFISIAVLIVDPAKGITKEFTTIYTGSQTAWLLIPTAILLPVLLGLLRLLGGWYSFYTNEFGAAIYAISIILTFLGVIWYNTRLLNKRDILKIEAEKALKESEEQIQAIFKAAPDAVIVINETGEIAQWNKQAETLFGWTAGEVTGKLFSDIVLPEQYRLAHQNALYRFIKTGESSVLNKTFEISALKRDNRGFDAAISLSPTMLKDKYLFIVFVRDITEHKKMEKQLKRYNEDLQEQVKIRTEEIRQSEEKYRTLIEQASDAIFINDQQGNLAHVNSKACQMLGYTQEQLLNMNITDLYTAEELSQRPLMVSNLIRGESTNVERNMLHSDGTTLIPVNITAKMTSSGLIMAIARDITEQIKAQEEIRDRAMQLHSISNSIPGIITYQLIRDFDGSMKFTYISESVKQFTGKTSEDIIRDPGILYNLILDEDKEMFARAEQESYLNLSVFDVEVRSRNFYGEVRWLHIRSVPRKLKDRRVIWDGVHMDITEGKHAENELKEKEEQIRLFVENSPAVLAMLDKDMKYIITSKRWKTDYNLGDKEIIGKSHYEVFPEIPQRWKEIHQRCLAGASEKKEEDMFVRADGSVDWVRWEILPWHKHTGETGGIIMFTEVITERVKAELLLAESERNIRHILSSSSDSFYVINKNCVVTVINQQASANLEKAWGHPVTVGTNILALMPSEKEEPVKASLEKVFAGEKVEYEIFLSHEGLAPWWLVNYMPVFDENGQVTGAYISTKDISVRKKTEELLNESYQDIRRLASHIEKVRELERIDIAREIHDELGQQLTVLKMDVSWLNKKLENKDEKVEQKMKQLLEVIDTTVKTVRRISTNLRPSVLDDLGLIAAIEWYNLEFEKRFGIKVKFTPGMSELKLPAEIVTPLFRVYQETLTNVARHAKASGVETSLKMENGRLIMGISDDGKGFVVEGIENKKTLGILSMRERISLIKGECIITSAPEKGTAIEVIVPVSSSN